MEHKASSVQVEAFKGRWWEDIFIPVESGRVMSADLPQGIDWALLAKFPEDALGAQKFVKCCHLGA